MSLPVHKHGTSFFHLFRFFLSTITIFSVYILYHFLKIFVKFMGWHWLIKVYRFRVYNTLFLLNLLGWHWLIKLYSLQVYLFYNTHTSSVHCIVWSPPQVRSPSVTSYPPFTLSYLLPPLSPPGNHCAVVCLWGFLFFFLNLFTFLILPPKPSPLTAISLFSISMSLSLFSLLVYFVHQIPHINEIIWGLSFSDWSISLNAILLRSVRAVTNGKITFFLWPSSISSGKWTTAFLSTHLHLGCFKILAIINNIVMYIRVHIFFWISVLRFFRYISRSGIAGL